jgi:hypothetical protein
MKLEVVLILFLVLIIPAILIHYAKMYVLISEYNLLPPEVRKKINWPLYTRFIRDRLVILAVLIVLLWWLFRLLNIGDYYPLVLIFLVIFFSAMILTRRRKYIRLIDLKEPFPVQAYAGIRSMTKLGLYAILLSIGIIVVVFYTGLRTPDYRLQQKTLTSKGLYNINLPIRNISTLELLERMPDIEQKTNGYAFAGRYRGYFKVSTIGPCLLYVEDIKQPAILIITNSGNNILINYHNAEKTKELYNDLSVE